jgi:hypothetical protein
MAWLTEMAAVLADTVFDVLPILAVLVFFQLFVLREKLANPRRIAIGFLYVLVGLTLFLVGLEKALFPLGEVMAAQLTADAMEGVVQGAADPASLWQRYFWVYVFAAAIGFATTVAEPALSSRRSWPWPSRPARSRASRSTPGACASRSPSGSRSAWPLAPSGSSPERRFPITSSRAISW